MFANRNPGNPTKAPTKADITARASLNDHSGGGSLNEYYYNKVNYQLGEVMAMRS